MKHIITQVEINADAATIWHKLIDLASYPQWNPTVETIRGDVRPGGALEVTLRPLLGKRKVHFETEITELEENKVFGWRGIIQSAIVFDTFHYWRLEFISDDVTRVIHGHRFKGFLSFFLIKKLTPYIIDGMSEANEALKKACEADFKNLRKTA